MMKDLTFLEEGRFTARDETVKKIAQELEKSGKEPLDAISYYVSCLKAEKNRLHRYIPMLREMHKLRIFRKRTASQILKEGYVTGCTDTALAFIVLARELGIPTRYVETLSESTLKNSNKLFRSGHVFTDVLIDNQWRVYEPIWGFIENNEYAFNGKKNIEVGKGLDFSEIYLKEDGGYHKMPINLQSLDEAIIKTRWIEN